MVGRLIVGHQSVGPRSGGGGEHGRGDSRPGRGVLAGVGQQVGDNLVQALLVADDLDRLGWQLQLPHMVRSQDAGVGDRFEEQPGQVDRQLFDRASGVEPGQQQQILHQCGHPDRLGPHLVQRGPKPVDVLGPASRQLGVAFDRRERRAELVGGVGDELADLLLAALPR